MYYKFIIYFILCGSIFLIPAYILEKIIQFVRLRTQLLEDKLKNFSFFEFIRGQELLFSFSKIETMYLSGKINNDINLIEYKFYTRLVTRLISLSKSHGISLKKFLPEIKKSLSEDVKFELKIKDEITNGIFQFSLVTLVTWGFVYLSQSLVSIKINYFIYGSMLAIQIAGLILFVFISSKLKGIYFRSFASTLSELYVFITEFELGIPLNLVLNDSQVLSNEFSKNKNFIDLFNHFINLLDRLKNTGIGPSEDVHLIIKNIWDERSLKFEKFHKHLTFIKFLHLALIYLPVYFLYMACIFKFFMEQ